GRGAEVACYATSSNTQVLSVILFDPVIFDYTDDMFVPGRMRQCYLDNKALASRVEPSFASLEEIATQRFQDLSAPKSWKSSLALAERESHESADGTWTLRGDHRRTLEHVPLRPPRSRKVDSL